MTNLFHCPQSARGDIEDLIETLKCEMEDTNEIVGIVSSTVDNSERKLKNAQEAIADVSFALESHHFDGFH